MTSTQISYKAPGSIASKFLKSNARRRVILGPFGCVGGDTLVATEFGVMPIAHIDRPMRVLSWNEKTYRFQLSWCGGAFPKGRDYLYRVKGPSGEFAASGHHRLFCAEHSYQPVESLCPGQSALRCSDIPLETKAAVSQMSLRPDVRNSTQKAVSSLARYAESARRYGRQFLSEEDIALDSSPSQDGVQISACPFDRGAVSQTGGRWAPLREHIRQGLFDGLRQIDGLLALAAPQYAGAEHQIAEEFFGRTEGSVQSRLRSLLSSGSHQREIRPVGCSRSTINSISEWPIVSVEREPVKRAYWDLQVLDTNNYVTSDGAIHHNSGKSVACCVEIMRRSREQAPNAEGIRKTRWAVVRNTYPDLKNTTVKTWQAWWGDAFGSFLNVAPFVHHMKFKMPDGTMVDSEVIFLAMDTEADAKKFLSLELTGIYFNEVRELQRSVIEAGDGRLGRYPSMKDGGPSWYGMIADTNMPDEDHWLYGLAEDSKTEGWEFFHQPGGVIKVDGKWVQNPLAENTQNLTPGYYTGQIAGKSDEWIAVHLAAEYGRLSTEGAYFNEELIALEREGRIQDNLLSPDLPVHTFWDIGMHDYMAIWLGQCAGDIWNWIGYYENSGQSIDHYVRWLDDFKNANRIVYGDHVWPHDGTHRDVGILGAKTRAEVFVSLKQRAPIIMPKRQNPADWIDATRLLLRKSRFDRDTKIGLNHLRKYSKRKDQVRNVYLNEPRHDEHSHGADAFQVAGMGRGRVSNSTAQWSDEIMNFEFVGAA